MKAIKRTSTLLLFIITSFHIASNYIWLKIDQSYLTYDAHHHFLLSLSVFNQIQKNIIPIFSRVLDQHIFYRWHGPLVAYITAPYYFITGTSQDAGTIISSIFFFSILLISTYAIGKHLYNKKSGVLAAFIVGMYPIIFIHSRIYMLDLPLTAITTLSIYFLIKSKSFSYKKYSLLFIFSVIMGLSIKLINFAGIMIGPTSIILFNSVKNYPAKRKKMMVYIGSSLLIIILALLPFLQLKSHEVFSRLSFCSWLNPDYYTSHPSLWSLLIYWFKTGLSFIKWTFTKALPVSISPALFVTFLIGAILFTRKAKINKIEKRVIYIWLALPILFLGFFFHQPRISRYLMPILPPIAIISTIGVFNINFKKTRRILLSIIVIFSCLQYFNISYLHNTSLNFGNFRTSNAFNPHQNEYPYKKLLREIMKQAKKDVPLANMVFFVDPIHYIYNPIKYLSKKNNYPLKFSIVSLSRESKYKESNDFFSKVKSSDYLIILKNPIKETQKEIIHARDNFEKHRDNFQLIKEFPLNTNNKILLFKNKQQYTSVSKDDLKLRFRGGTARIIYKSTPLFSSTGISGSFTYKNKTFRLTEAKWNLKQLTPSKIVAISEWKNCPVRQKLTINILSGQKVKFEIHTSNTTYSVKNLVFSFCFPRLYKSWEGANQQKIFTKKGFVAYTKKDLPPAFLPVTVKSPYENYPDIALSAASKNSLIKPFLKYNKAYRWFSFKLIHPKNKPYRRDELISFILEIEN